MIEDYGDIKGLLPWDDEEEEVINPDPTPQPEAFPEIHEADPGATSVEDDTSKIMWHAMEEYHSMGFSMMWGRAEDDPKSDKKAKSPIVATWSSNEDTMFTLHTLANVMAKQTIKIAPIIICGKASGNLIVIDIDVKHMPGIDVKFLTALRETYPELYKLIRRHKTPSSGYHLLYRTIEFIQFVPKNPGLAYPAEGKMAGIETRTHGGYVMAPPGLGYSVEYDVPVPTISVEDHEKIFALARLFNERTKVIKPRAVKSYEEIYDENPFDHFNNSPNAEKVLELNGWKFDYENTQFTHWTRPGKGGGVSASWHKEKRFFHFFTSSTEFDDSHFNGNYSPAAAKCLLEANNDYKKLYLILQKEGYGKHKPDYEAKYVKKAVETGKPLPANFSKEAQAQLEVAVSEKDSKYPHGIYWQYNPTNNTYSIQRELLSQFMHNIGLRLHKKEPVIIEGQFIRKLKENKNENGDRDVFDILKSWIREEDYDTYLAICHELNKFWQASGQFAITTLSKLDTSLILKSNSKIVYKCFLNGILIIGDGPKRLAAYSELSDRLVWSDRIIQKEYNYVDKEQQKTSMWVDFLGKALVTKPEYVQLCIGYLVCGYKAVDESYFILMEEPRNSSKGGGSGKGYFFKAMSPMVSVLVINGESIKKDIDQLLQSHTGQELIHLSDFPKWVNLSSLKNHITDDVQKKILYKDIINTDYEETPKFVGSGQFGLDTKSDGGVAGRVRELAFTDYFGRNYNKISDEYGGHCPDVWDSENRKDNRDWDGYFSYMADAIELWLGVRNLEVVEDKGLWEKGFDIRYSGGDGYLREAIEDQIKDWRQLSQVSVTMVIDWYRKVCDTNEISGRNKLGIEKLHMAIREYGQIVGGFDYRYGDSMGVGRENVEGVRARIVKIIFPEEEEGWDKIQEEKGDLEVKWDDEEIPF